MHTFLFITTVLLLTLFSATLLAEESAVYQWQIKRLMSPDDRTLAKEKSQSVVFIYENLKLSDVEKALDEHFSRMENMMFVGTLLPPTAAGGVPQKEEDGCD